MIYADTKYLLNTHVSFTHSTRDAERLMNLARKRAGKTPRIVVTDKLRSYLTGIEKTLITDAQHRPGGPFDIENSTSLIESFHKILEQRPKVFQYQDIKSIRLLIDGWLINYNYFKQNEGCGNIPPAQAMRKVVPFKDWNDVVIAKVHPDHNYHIRLVRT